MKRCPKCNRLYSDMTEKCPQCGIFISGGTDSSSNGGGTQQQPQSSYQQTQNSYQQTQNSYQQPQNSYQQPQDSYQYSQNSYQQSQNSYQQTQNNIQNTQTNYQSYNNASDQQRTSSASGKMGFFDAIGSCFNKYAKFSGRASRAEYWWFYLFAMLCNGVGNFISYNVSMLIGYIIIIAISIPLISAGWRRMHDVGKCGAFMFIPIYNLILLISRGEAFDNQYGPVPDR